MGFAQCGMLHLASRCIHMALHGLASRTPPLGLPPSPPSSRTLGLRRFYVHRIPYFECF